MQNYIGNQISPLPPRNLHSKTDSKETMERRGEEDSETRIRKNACRKVLFRVYKAWLQLRMRVKRTCQSLDGKGGTLSMVREGTVGIRSSKVEKMESFKGAVWGSEWGHKSKSKKGCRGELVGSVNGAHLLRSRHKGQPGRDVAI